MKKFLSILLSGLLVVAFALGLVGCNKPHEHELRKIEAKEKTCTTDGNYEYYACDCGVYFADAEGKVLVMEGEWIIPASHTLTRTGTKAVGCVGAENANGNGKYYACVCGKYFADADAKNEIAKDSWIITSTEHQFSTRKEYVLEGGKIYSVYVCDCGAQQKEKTEVVIEGGFTELTPTNFASIVSEAETGTYVLTAGDYSNHAQIDNEDYSKYDITFIAVQGVQIKRFAIKRAGGIDNITFKGFCFDGNANGADGITIATDVAGLTIVDCQFLNATAIVREQNAFVDNMTVQNCLFHQSDYNKNGEFSPIYVSDASGEVLISGNKFINCRFNAIQLGGTYMTADVVIENNYINGTRSRAFRFVNVSSQMIIRNNVIDNVQSSEIIAINNVYTTISFEGNTYGGEAWEPGDIIGSGGPATLATPR